MMKSFPLQTFPESLANDYHAGTSDSTGNRISKISHTRINKLANLFKKQGLKRCSSCGAFQIVTSKLKGTYETSPFLELLDTDNNYYNSSGQEKDTFERTYNRLPDSEQEALLFETQRQNLRHQQVQEEAEFSSQLIQENVPSSFIYEDYEPLGHHPPLKRKRRNSTYKFSDPGSLFDTSPSKSATRRRLDFGQQYTTNTQSQQSQNSPSQNCLSQMHTQITLTQPNDQGPSTSQLSSPSYVRRSLLSIKSYPPVLVRSSVSPSSSCLEFQRQQ